MKGFIFPAIYQMHVVLNFLNNHEKQKNQQNHSFISEAKQKVKKKAVNLRAQRTRKKKCTWFKQGLRDEWWREIYYLEILIIMTGIKTFEFLVNCFMNFLIILSFTLVQIFYRPIKE